MKGLGLSGRIAVISGGCGDIGRAVRERLISLGAN